MSLYLISSTLCLHRKKLSDELEKNNKQGPIIIKRTNVCKYQIGLYLKNSRLVTCASQVGLP